MTPPAQPRATYREAMDAAARAVVAAAKEHGMDIPFATLIAEAAVGAYLPLHAELSRKRARNHYGDNTQTLAQLSVWGEAVLPPIALGTLHGRFKSARDLMQNDKAMWSHRRLPDGRWSVRRLPDGAERPRILKSRISAELATLAPGQSVISTAIRSIRGAGALMTSHRHAARLYLDAPEANWTTRATNQGVRLTRVQ